MQGDDEDDEADLIDSFFLPGGILDPEYSSQENERDLELEDMQLQKLQRIPGTAVASTTVGPVSGTRSGTAMATGSETGDQSRVHPMATNFPTFSPVINPNNPWAMAGTGAEVGVAIAATSATTAVANSTNLTQQQIQLQHLRKFASDPIPTGTASDFTDDFFPSLSSPTRQLRLPNLMDPQLQRMQGLPLAVPPGFEFTKKHLLVPPSLSLDARGPTPVGDDESIQGVPRELLQESMQGQDFDEGSCTSSLSHSTVPTDDDDDHDGPLLKDANSEGAVDPRADSQPDLRYSPDETLQAKDPQTPNASSEQHRRSQLTDDDYPDVTAATLQLVDQLETLHELELIVDSPGSQESSVKSLCHTSDTGANLEPISPFSDRAIPENQVTSPTKAKARKRRGHKKSKSSLAPKRIASEESLTQVDLPNLTMGELDERAVLTQERSSSVSGQTQEANRDKLIQTHNLIVFNFLKRLSFIFMSFMISMYQAAVAEVMIDNLALVSYIFFSYSPLISERMVAELCLPHWTSHFISCIAVWILCSPPEGIKDRALSFLPPLRIAYVLGVLIDGFSDQQPRIMRLPPSVRMQLVFIILAIRRGFWNSHFLGLSLGLQVLLSDLPGDLLLVLIGLASLNYKRQLVLKTAVMIASKTD